LTRYLRANLQVLAGAVAQMARAPSAALMTIAAIGVTLALPAMLYVITENIDRLSDEWDDQARVNLFLSAGVADVGALQRRLQSMGRIDRIESIPPEQGLEDFKEYSGFARAGALLDTNPLPWTLVVHLADGHRDIAAVEAFIEQTSAMPEIDNVRSDVLWLRRLGALVEIGHRLVWVLALLLGVAVVVIISNTVRLAIVSRADEIEVIKLVGGTDRFIRRPFLYQGFVQGALGAVTAVVLVTVCIEALREPVTVLVSEFGGGHRVLGLSWSAAAALLILGSGLGWLASRWSVGRHLRDIEPR